MSEKIDKKKIKVLIGIDTYLPHIDGVINCMSNYIKNYGPEVEVTVIAPSVKGYKDEADHKVVRCKSITIPAFNLKYALPKWDKAFKKEVESEKYDIVHVHSPFNIAKYAIKVAKKQNIPIVATGHTNFRPIFKEVFKSKWLTEKAIQTIGKTHNQMQECWVCSPAVKKQMQSFGTTIPFEYVPFGTELKKVDNLEQLKLDANKHFNLQENENVFLFVGRLMKLKRVDFILDALKIVKDKGYKFKFFIAGKGKDENYYINYALKLGFTKEEVQFLGFMERETMPMAYGRADLFLFPSHYDNFGLTKVEAAAFATPSLLIEGTNAAYGINHMEDGILSKDTPEGFAQHIIDAIKNKERTNQIGLNAQQTVYYSWADAAKEVVKNYKRVIKNFDKNKED